MKRSLDSIKGAVILSALVATCQLAWAQTLQLFSVDVNSAGNIDGVSIALGSGAEYFAGTVQGYNAYCGGLFNTIGGYNHVNNQWTTIRTINNDPNTATYVPLYGLPSWPGGLTANNVFKLVYNSGGGYFTASPLTAGGYGGNGVNGRVRALALSSNGDLYVGGDFSTAGGFPYSSAIGVYRASGGWQTAYIFSAFDYVSSLTWVSYPTKLKVEGVTQPNNKHLWQVELV